MVVCPLKHTPDLAPLLLNQVPLEKVIPHKVLGMTIMDNLKWNKNTDEIMSKASKCLYTITVLNKAGVPSNDLTCIYSSLIRPTLEYCCVLWCNSVPKYLSAKIETIQKHAMRIIFPDYHYSEALVAVNFSQLDKRYLEICQKVLIKINEPDSRLHHLLPPTCKECVTVNLRNSSNLSLPKCRTERYKNSFFPAMAYMSCQNNHS